MSNADALGTGPAVKVKKMFGVEVSVNWRHNPNEKASRETSGGDDK